MSALALANGLITAAAYAILVSMSQPQERRRLLSGWRPWVGAVGAGLIIAGGTFLIPKVWDRFIANQPTRILPFTPPNGTGGGEGLSTGEWELGRCTEHSSRVNPGNPAARRCVDVWGTEYDPCFENSVLGLVKVTDGKTVPARVCFAAPWITSSVPVIRSEDTLPDTPERKWKWETKRARPWALELSTGHRCVRDLTPSVEAPSGAKYTCGDERGHDVAWVIGFPDRSSGRTWTVFVNEWATRKTRPVDVNVAWY